MNKIYRLQRQDYVQEIGHTNKKDKTNCIIILQMKNITKQKIN